MAEDKPRLARLTAILTQLQSKRLITARDIAEKHNVSIRTVYRDIRTLENSGIPIVTEDGKGYSISQGYKLPPVMFTEEEANALITAEHFISKNKDKSLILQYGNAIEKIKSVMRYTQKDKAELLSTRMHIRINPKAEQTSNYLAQLQSAITNFQLVHLNYISLKKEWSERTVEPFALLHTQENWLLIAHCRLRKGFRLFRLDCIESLQMRTEKFEPHNMTLQEYFEEAKKKWENNF